MNDTVTASELELMRSFRRWPSGHRAFLSVTIAGAAALLRDVLKTLAGDGAVTRVSAVEGFEVHTMWVSLLPLSEETGH